MVTYPPHLLSSPAYGQISSLPVQRSGLYDVGRSAIQQTFVPRQQTCWSAWRRTPQHCWNEISLCPDAFATNFASGGSWQANRRKVPTEVRLPPQRTAGWDGIAPIVGLLPRRDQGRAPVDATVDVRRAAATLGSG